MVFSTQSKLWIALALFGAAMSFAQAGTAEIDGSKESGPSPESTASVECQIALTEAAELLRNPHDLPRYEFQSFWTRALKYIPADERPKFEFGEGMQPKSLLIIEGQPSLSLFKKLCTTPHALKNFLAQNKGFLLRIVPSPERADYVIDIMPTPNDGLVFLRESEGPHREMFFLVPISMLATQKLVTDLP